MSQQLRALEQEFIQSAHRKCSELEELLAELETTLDVRSCLEALARLAHDLAGTAGTYGYLRVTDHARTLTDRIRHVLDRGGVANAVELKAWGRLSESIRAQFCASPPKLEAPPSSRHGDPGPSEAPAEPTTILCVEDRCEQASWLSSLLSSQGYRFIHCASANDFDAVFRECEPDLVLMDVDLPDGDGLQLACQLREQANGFAVPIVFLTAETHPTARVNALAAGADEFLTKPVDAGLLLCAIEGRARRSKLAQARMSYDGLTGLLNRTAFVERATGAVSRLRRASEAQASLVLLDLDHFKRINDRYGHAIGDAVLQALARVIQSNFRRSDFTGRIGGEEFALLLEDAPPAAAKVMMERLLYEFSVAPIEHGPSRVTFSAGVAGFVLEHRDFAHWLEVADMALYRAKAAGRECVVIA